MSSKVYIYTLSEEGSDKVKYVGQTVSPGTRLVGHFHVDGLVESNPKRLWLEDVKSRNGTIAMDIIDECSIDEAADREQQWIDHHNAQGSELTNSAKAIKSRLASSSHVDILKSLVPKRSSASLFADDVTEQRLEQRLVDQVDRQEKLLEYNELLIALIAAKVGVNDGRDALSPVSKTVSAMCENFGIMDDAIRFLMKERSNV